MFFSDLDPRSVRERVDMTQIWEAWREAEEQRRHSFTGFLDWEERNGKEYLYRRKKKTVKSLGPRSEETERIRRAFHAGRQENSERLSRLGKQMNQQASILKAMGLGRMPVPAARILRAIRLAAPHAAIRVVGTNALYAYEALAGVRFDASTTATGDIDLLLDDRNRLKLLTESGEEMGLIGLIHREVDKSFQPRNPRDFRLTNKNGYMVEFIRPEPRPIFREMPGGTPLVAGDVEPAPIGGLQWLINAPAVEAVAIDDGGFPVPMRTPDPRFWAAHKLWLAGREDRDPQKKIRDGQQGRLLVELIARKLPQFPFEEEFVRTLPRSLRSAVEAILKEQPRPQQDKPDW